MASGARSICSTEQEFRNKRSRRECSKWLLSVDSWSWWMFVCLLNGAFSTKASLTDWKLISAEMFLPSDTARGSQRLNELIALKHFDTSKSPSCTAVAFSSPSYAVTVPRIRQSVSQSVSRPCRDEGAWSEFSIPAIIFTSSSCPSREDCFKGVGISLMRKAKRSGVWQLK